MFNTTSQLHWNWGCKTFAKDNGVLHISESGNIAEKNRAALYPGNVSKAVSAPSQ